MTLGEILFIYRARLRQRSLLGQELLAILGIAVGVALLFASQVASTSLDGSVKQLDSQLVGAMQWQLDARGQEGVSQAIVAEAGRLPGVRSDLPLIEQPATVSAAGGHASVVLLGIGVGFTRTDAALFRHVRLLNRVTTRQIAHLEGIALPERIASDIGVESLEPVSLEIGGRSRGALVEATLRKSEVGALVDGQIVLTPIAYAQRLTGMRGRVSRVYVAVDERESGVAHRALAALAARDHLDLEPAQFDSVQFAVAAGPAQQGEQLFAAISAVAGFLFAFGSMLLTVPSRRSLIEAVRRRGTTRAMTAQLLGFDALILGVLACILGLALGDLLSIELFGAAPGYLAFAFPVGTQRIIDWQTIVLSVLAGMIAAFAGVLVPLRAVMSRPLRFEDRRPSRSRAVGAARLLIGACGLATTTVILIAAPQAAVVGSVTLALALVCLLPFVFDAVIWGFGAIQAHVGGAAGRLAHMQLRDPQSRVRSIAVATTGAVAVFGSVAILGAQHNLQSALSRTAREWNGIAALWVSPKGASNTLATTPFAAGTIGERIAATPGVRSVSTYRGGFLSIGRRRAWVIAPPSNSPELVPAGQLTSGNARLVNDRLRTGRWVVLSEAIAAEMHATVGQLVRLPTPRPLTLRVAALSTNAGWPPGAIMMSASAYAAGWSSSQASAFNVRLRPGETPGKARASIVASLRGDRALAVQTSTERAQEWRIASAQGLSRLSQIATLVLIAAVLAMAVVMASMIWQRRGRIAYIKRQGFDRGVLWRALLWESAVLLGTGCLTGALAGIYGQLLISHALAVVTGFPIDITAGPIVAVTSFAIVSVAALAIVAVPGYLAVRVRPTLAHPA